MKSHEPFSPLKRAFRIVLNKKSVIGGRLLPMTDRCWLTLREGYSVRGGLLHVDQVDQVVAFGLDAQAVGRGFVERSLPKHGGVVGRIYEVIALEAGGPEVEERYLLTLRGLQQGVAAAGDEGAPVGDGYGLHAHLQVVDQEGDVAQGVVVAASGDAQHHESAASASVQVAHGLAEVVSLLFIYFEKLHAVALGQSGLN